MANGKGKTILYTGRERTLFFTQVPKVLVFYNGFTTLGTFIELLLVALIS